MRVLIVCQTINDQVNFLAQELENMSLSLEVVDSVHPLRLLVNKYDLIHFIHNDNNIELKTILSAWSAKALGAATVFTTYSRLEPSMLKEIEFNFFDALTLPYISELKKARFFNKPKMILPFFPKADLQPLKQPSLETQQFVFPVLNSFDDLLKINLTALPALVSREQLYVDAHLLREKTGSSVLRKNWTAFLKSHPQFQNFKVFTERSTLMEVLEENSTYTFIHHLDLASDQVAFWMETAITLNNFIILHEDQATGFPNFWKTEKNCLIYSPRMPSTLHYQLTNQFIEQHPSPEKLTFDYRNSLDLKLNEVARLYTKVVAQRASLMHPSSAKMNS